MPPVGFEPTVSAGERPQTYALDRAATGTGCLTVTFLILCFVDILEDLLRESISVASTRILLFSVSLHVSEPYNKLLLINAL